MNEQGASETGPPGGTTKRRGGCFRTGCLGCLGLGAILVGGVGLMFLVAVFQGPPEPHAESANISRAVPATGTGGATAPAVPLDAIAPGTGGGPETGAGELPAPRPGRIVLDLSMGDFRIEPGPAGTPIRVEADYDSGAYEMEEHLDPGGEEGWTYELTFGSRVSLFRQMLAGSEPDHNRVKLIIPKDVPVAISGRVGVGESRVELGGLWITDVALTFGVGEHRVSFMEPTREPVEEIFLRTSVGEFAVRRLGNASPRRAMLSQSIGESRCDLRGTWLRDGQVSLDCGVGECSVRLPGDEVNVDVTRATLMIGESRTRSVQRRRPAPPGAPTLSLSMSQTLGEQRISN
ncbi:MAG: hypothetical protein ACE5IK_09545 [Acidobacteriota bacterium]